MRTTFEAKYPGLCHGDCWEYIKPGELVCYNDDGEIVHADCGTKARGDDPAKACPDCHLIHPTNVKECE